MPEIIVTTVSLSDRAMQVLIAEQAQESAFKSACLRLAEKRRVLNRAQRECHDAEQEVIRMANELSKNGLTATIALN